MRLGMCPNMDHVRWERETSIRLVQFRLESGGATLNQESPFAYFLVGMEILRDSG